MVNCRVTCMARQRYFGNANLKETRRKPPQWRGAMAYINQNKYARDE